MQNWVCSRCEGHAGTTSSMELIKWSFIAASHWMKVSTSPCIKIGLGSTCVAQSQTRPTRHHRTPGSTPLDAKCQVEPNPVFGCADCTCPRLESDFAIRAEKTVTTFEEIRTFKLRSAEFGYIACSWLRACLLQAERDAELVAEVALLTLTGCNGASLCDACRKYLGFLCRNAKCQAQTQHDGCNILDASPSKPGKGNPKLLLRRTLSTAGLCSGKKSGSDRSQLDPSAVP